MTYRQLLQARDYRLLFSGQVLSQFGDAVYEVGIVWLVYQMTSSAAALGWLALSQSVPFLVLGLLAGAYADRWDRRVTMMVSDALRGVAVVYLAVRYFYGDLSVVEVCAVAAVLTAARSFFHPAMRGMFPQILGRERLLLANSLSEAAKRVCKVGGMMLGGLMMAWGAVDLMLWLNAGSFFLSLWTIWLIRSRTDHCREVGRVRKGWVVRDIFAAGKVVFSERSVLLAIVVSSVGLVVSTGLIKIGLPLLAGEVLMGDGDLYGLLMACFSVGMFVAAAAVKRETKMPIVGLVAVGWVLYGLMFLTIANVSWMGTELMVKAGWEFHPALIFVIPAVMMIGLAHFLTDVPVTTLIQQRIPMERMSASQSIWATSSFGAESVSVALTGVVLAGVPLLPAFAGAGALLFLLGLPVLIKVRGNGQNALDRRSLAE